RGIEGTGRYRCRRSEKGMVEWSVTLDGKPRGSGEVPLGGAAQDNELMELAELPEPRSSGRLGLTVHVVQPNAAAWTNAEPISAGPQWRRAETLSGTPPPAPHATPHLPTGEGVFCSGGVKRCGNFNRQSGFLSQMWIG
ncbi:beta-galactosidase, partial [Escherichia coli]|nr:beta-galactosidase [Escherichia coli]